MSNNTEIKNAESVENTKIEETKPKHTRKRTTTKKTTTAKKTTKEVKKSGIDLDAILSVEKVSKKALSFNQNKNVADKLEELAKAKEKKVSETLNLILESIVDVDAGVCKVDIEEEKQEKVQNTFKVNAKVLEVLKTEASKRKMSLNDYLNKVMEIVLNLK
ncbi:hypothetical protein [Clostridium perfringens]|uniref:hypothetical protein n=1 Tax=Clostridium perfringens TaxID=1502 RepID=UPI002AC6C29C|nr:hypothetical protein [Clostridium perfringens]MDZ4906856.1 hypothetical protein [Clostridium perfringens]